ncbi:hypothetical protein PMKS-000626 [Pichia membranifaciens]|uniref:Calcium-transporting ATPase n=1 Tax=Pichia membranifaciens TaxID=4926 RepID=A0A1Q2YCN8_9ASCO|nr:hypothetical protein PMKS-000626 [Pichia membranifaciens]
MDYFNDEIKSLNSGSNTDLNSSSSSFQFDVGDDGVLDPFLISGSKLLSGQGKALVLCIGENSVNGKLMMALSNDDEEEDVTPLQHRLNLLADGISKYGFLASIVLFVVLFSKFVFQLSTDLDGMTTAEKLSSLINILITAITIVVVAIPEGLPLAVTLALAFATTRMTSDGNLVRVLKSCETMGGATTICSDKTGTLTINKMTIVKGLVGPNKQFDDLSNPSSLDPDPSSNSSVDVLKSCSEKLIGFLLKNILLNSSAFENNQDDEDEGDNVHIDMDQGNQNKSFWSWLPFIRNRKYNHLLPSSAEDNHENDDNEDPIATGFHERKDDFVGSKTECALLSLVKDKFSQFDHSIPTLHQYRESNEPNVVKVIPFESSIKWSGIVYHDSNDDSYTFYIKGAAEIVLASCHYLTDYNGKAISLDEDEMRKLQGIREKMALDALRAVSLAHYTFDKSELSNINWDDITPQELISYSLHLDLMVGIQDPLRPGVKNAIEQCHKAGVDVRMVTGDNILTARSISRNCGILNEETFDDSSYFMEGPQFRKLSHDERLKVVRKLHILARSSPEDKRILVQTLKELGEVVAVTGDGTNDAPALKLADVGFSMGLSGTEVAREASDIVLMSDDFTSIVNAIKWGRTVAASIRKFVQFQLTVNFTAVILTFVTAVVSEENSSVLTAVQLLWVNLIMDTLAALALATDKPDDDVLDSKPEGRNDQMISTQMWKMIIGMAIFQLIITLGLDSYGSYLFYGKSNGDLKMIEKMMLKSMTFNTFVWLQVFTLFVSRILNEPLELNEHSTLMQRLSPRNVGFFRHLSRNFWFLGIVGLISLLQVAIMFYGGPAFSVAPQSVSMWLTALISGYLMIPCGLFLRVLPNEWLLKVLPIPSIKKFIDYFEWFVFGCGIKCCNGGGDDYSHHISEDEEGIDGDRRISSTAGIDDNANDYFSQPPTGGNKNLSGNIDQHGSHNPDIVISGTPSPLLGAETYGTIENHKMARLTGILSSSNTSTSSLNGAPFTRTENSKPYLKSGGLSQEYLFDGATGNTSYTDTNASAMKSTAK